MPIPLRALVACVMGAALHAQTRLPPAPLLNDDPAVLESPEARNELNCAVTAVKPYLGFDLRFHTGYEAGVPMASLPYAHALAIVFRVTSEKQNRDPVYFSQRVPLPALEDTGKGAVHVQGSFDLGEGQYRVDWLVRDSVGHVCSRHWPLEATLPARDRDLPLALAPGTAEPSEEDLFRPEPPGARAPDGRALAVKVLADFAPQNEDAVTLQPEEMFALISLLRAIAREPGLGNISLVAFNLRDQRILYRQEGSRQIDFPALGRAVQAPASGTIDIRTLGRKHGDTEFLTRLLGREMEAKSDAFIFTGLKVALDEKVPAEALRRVGDPGFPIFYLNFNPDPLGNPWRDTIGEVVRFFKGLEYTISRPRDLGYAWNDVRARLRTPASGHRASRQEAGAGVLR